MTKPLLILMVKVAWFFFKQEKGSKRGVLFQYVSIKKEKILLFFFPSTTSQDKLE